MTIRQHLDGLQQNGFYTMLTNSQPQNAEIASQIRMKTELSLAFPLLHENGKALLQIAWSPNREGVLSSDAVGETGGLQEAVEDLVEYGQFTDAQIQFIATEVLGMIGSEEAFQAAEVGVSAGI